MKNNSIYKFSFSTNDYDKFVEMLTVADAEQVLLEGGAFVGRARIIASQNVIINNFDINRRVLQKGVVTPGFITFAIFDPSCMFNWRKNLMKKGMIGVLYKNEHESVSGANFKGLPVAIKYEYFKEVCIRKGFSGIIEHLNKTEMIHVSELKLSRIRHLIKVLSQSGTFNDHELYYYLENTLVDWLVDCLSDSVNSKPEREFEKSDFDNIVDYIHSNISEVSSVSKLSQKTHFSERTLRRWFKKKYDITPKQYLNLLRLNKVRKALKNDQGESSILEVASEFNFWHMGQFTRDYKHLFGELPSLTIKTPN